MQVFVSLLDELKGAKVGDKKSDYTDLLWKINDRMELILAHFGFDPTKVQSTSLFKETSDVRLTKVKARIQKQKEEPAAALVDAVNGGIKLINQLVEDKYQVFTKASFNMARRVFEVELAFNIWGESSSISKPSGQKAFEQLVLGLTEEGYIIKKSRRRHMQLVDMTQNRTLVEDALTKMFQAHGIQYEVYGDEIRRITFIVRPKDLPIGDRKAAKAQEKVFTTELTEDETSELARELSMVRSTAAMLSLNGNDQNMYLTILRSSLSRIEEIMGADDLSICRDLKAEHRAEREKNMEIHRLEEQAQAETLSLLKETELCDDVQRGLYRYVGAVLNPLRLCEFRIGEWNVVEFSLEPNRMPVRGVYEGHLDCITVDQERDAAIFRESQVDYIASLLREALPSVELVSVEVDYSHSMPLLNKMKFRLNDPADFVILMKNVPEKAVGDDEDMF